MKKIGKNLISLSFSTILLASSVYAADSAGISKSVTTLGANVAQKHMELKEGWNLIGINANLTLDELKSKLGSDNILIINGQGGIYRKGSARISFKKFEPGKGYYIKLASAKGLDYTPISYADKTIPLVAGWNKINPISDLTLETIKNQIGNKIITIRGGDGTIFKTSGRSNFTKFTEPYGYMVKVSEATTLQF
jgi:hypothetical protein